MTFVRCLPTYISDTFITLVRISNIDADKDNRDRIRVRGFASGEILSPMLYDVEYKRVGFETKGL